MIREENYDGVALLEHDEDMGYINVFNLNGSWVGRILDSDTHDLWGAQTHDERTALNQFNDPHHAADFLLDYYDGELDDWQNITFEEV